MYVLVVDGEKEPDMEAGLDRVSLVAVEIPIVSVLRARDSNVAETEAEPDISNLVVGLVVPIPRLPDR